MKQRYLWLLDAGHSPATRGKRSPVLSDGRQLLEWEFARDIVHRLRDILDELGIANHEITPHIHADLKPSARARLANYMAKTSGMKCRVVSIHGNAHRSTWSSAEGITVLYHPASKASKAMAEVFQNRLVRQTECKDRGIRPRTNLTLLKATRMPAILSENGFYSNRDECDDMLDGYWRDGIAGAHADAIEMIESGVLERR